MPNNRKERHHTVPKVYLRNFADKKEQIKVANLTSREIYPTNIINVSVNQNFYAVNIKKDDGKYIPPNYIEDWLGETIEGPVKSVFDKILVHKIWPLSPADREMLALFITVQYLRGKDQRDNADYLTSYLLATQIALGGKDNVPDEIWNQVQNGTLEVAHDTTYHTANLIKDIDNFFPYFNNKVFSLIRFEKGKLITSDVPVVIDARGDSFSNSSESTRIEGVGVGTASEFFFALSREVGLVMTKRSVFENVVYDNVVYENELLPDSHKGFNALAIINAKNEIYCHPEDIALLPSPLPSPRKNTIKVYGPSPEQWAKFGQERKN